MKHKHTGILTTVTLMTLFSAQASADFLGLPYGRTASPATPSELTADAGINYHGDFMRYGLRLNYGFSEQTTVYASVIKGDIDLDEVVDDGDGLAYGAGFFYHLEGTSFLDNTETSLHASYHKGEFDMGNYSVQTNQGVINSDIDLVGSEITLEVIVSGLEPFTESGAMWYASAGVSKQDSELEFSANIEGPEKESETEPAAGIGFVAPFSSGEIFGGYRYAGDGAVGAGYRYYFE